MSGDAPGRAGSGRACGEGAGRGRWRVLGRAGQAGGGEWVWAGSGGRETGWLRRWLGPDWAERGERNRAGRREKGVWVGFGTKLGWVLLGFGLPFLFLLLFLFLSNF